MSHGKKAIPSAVRRQVCANAGAEMDGLINDIPCANPDCDFMGTVQWTTNYKHWPIIGDLELDHIVPESRGGQAIPDNMQLLCRPCNRRKGAKV